jgi:hypothetical protein
MHSMPYVRASRGLRIGAGSPPTRISPESGTWAPDRTFMSVDFPAPLPPTRPTTSPALRLMLTPFTAWTPPNETRMSRISTR